MHVRVSMDAMLCCLQAGRHLTVTTAIATLDVTGCLGGAAGTHVPPRNANPQVHMFLGDDRAY